MISETTLGIVLGACEAASIIGLRVFLWDKKRKFFLSSPPTISVFGFKIKLVEKLVHMNTVGPLLVLAFLFAHIFIFGGKPREIILLICFFSLILMSATISYLYLRRFNEVIQIANGLLLFDRKLECKFYLLSAKRDGLELGLGILFSIPIPSTILSIPAFLLLFRERFSYLVPVERILDFVTAPGFGKIPFTLAVACSMLLDWLVITLFCALAAIYCNTITKWLHFKNEWLRKKGPMLDKSGREKLRVMYKAHQILHTFACNLVYSSLPILLCNLCVVIITSLFCLLKFRKILNAPLLALIGIIAGIASSAAGFLLPLASQITELSREFKAEFAKHAQKGKGDFRFLRSSPPLEWKVGGVYLIQHRTTLIIINNVIVAILINLLLSFR